MVDLNPTVILPISSALFYFFLFFVFIFRVTRYHGLTCLYKQNVSAALVSNLIFFDVTRVEHELQKFLTTRLFFFFLRIAFLIRTRYRGTINSPTAVPNIL